MHIDLRIYEQSAAINDRDWKTLIRMMIRSAPKVLLARSLLDFNCKIRFHDNNADPDTTESSDRGIYRVERTNGEHKIARWSQASDPIADSHRRDAAHADESFVVTQTFSPRTIAQPGIPMKLSRRPFTLLTTIIAVGAAALALTPTGVQAQAALDGVMAKKLITIAIPTDFPPYGFVGPDMNPQGLDIDMARLIATRLGVKVDLVPVTSTNRIPYLQTKKADLVISTLGKNAEREKVIDFTAAYSPFFQAVFAAKSLSIKSMADLAGKSVGVTRGAIEDIELSKNAPASADIKRFEDNNATVSAFVSGQVQAIATGASVAGNLMQRNPQLNAEYKLLLKDSPNFIGVGKGEDKLRLKINEVIAAAKAAGELEKLAQKWLGRPAGDLPN
jgi:polar amino acid transport system substrate-binding protein